MQVHLVGATQSEHFLAVGLGGDDPALRNEVRKVVRLFHDRHIGMPPHLARDIAIGFSVRHPEVSNPVRLAVYRRLLAALDATGSMKQDPRQFDHVGRPLFYELCLLPLGALLVEELDETYLFSCDSELEAVQSEAYDAYAERFEVLFRSVCEAQKGEVFSDGERDKVDKWDLFWKRAAHQLWGELQRLRHSGHGRSERGDTAFASVLYDDLLLQLICELDPSPKLKLDTGHDSLDLTDEQNAHLAHPKQGGVVGIHTSSRLEDIEDMLLSEMVLPPPLLADKLLNSSFFARHRPPPLDRKQQVMLIGASIDDADDPVVAFAKACWLNAIFRMAIVLAQSDLPESEIRFGQWRGQLGVIASQMRVGDYSHLKLLNPLTADRMQLHRFFSDAGWLPGFLSLMPPMQARGDGVGMMRSSPAGAQLQDILNSLMPDVSALDEEEAIDFGAALLVVVRQSGVPSAPMSPVRRQGPMDIFTLSIACPERLRGGEVFYLEDGQKGASSLTISGTAGEPIAREGLNKIAADLVSSIFQFYWEQVHG